MGKYGQYRALVTLLGAFAAAPAAADCRQALALGHDVSGSVDRREYALQVRGLARALRKPLIREAFLAVPDAPVRLYVYEWSGVGVQTEIVGWTDIRTTQDLDRIADMLDRPVMRPRVDNTAIGDGMLFGLLALQGQAECWRRTLDISGDGKNNTGITPADVQLSPLWQDITVNGLVIANDTSQARVPNRNDSAPVLVDYYHRQVVRGPNAFVELAIGYENYARAIERKLLKELETLAIGAIDPRRYGARCAG